MCVCVSVCVCLCVSVSVTDCVCSEISVTSNVLFDALVQFTRHPVDCFYDNSHRLFDRQEQTHSALCALLLVLWVVSGVTNTHSPRRADPMASAPHGNNHIKC